MDPAVESVVNLNLETYGIKNSELSKVFHETFEGSFGSEANSKKFGPEDGAVDSVSEFENFLKNNPALGSEKTVNDVECSTLGDSDNKTSSVASINENFKMTMNTAGEHENENENIVPAKTAEEISTENVVMMPVKITSENETENNNVVKVPVNAEGETRSENEIENENIVMMLVKTADGDGNQSDSYANESYRENNIPGVSLVNAIHLDHVEIQEPENSPNLLNWTPDEMQNRSTTLPLETASYSNSSGSTPEGSTAASVDLPHSNFSEFQNSEESSTDDKSDAIQGKLLKTDHFDNSFSSIDTGVSAETGTSEYSPTVEMSRANTIHETDGHENTEDWGLTEEHPYVRNQNNFDIQAGHNTSDSESDESVYLSAIPSVKEREISNEVTAEELKYSTETRYTSNESYDSSEDDDNSENYDEGDETSDDYSRSNTEESPQPEDVVTEDEENIQLNKQITSLFSEVVTSAKEYYNESMNFLLSSIQGGALTSDEITKFHCDLKSAILLAFHQCFQEFEHDDQMKLTLKMKKEGLSETLDAQLHIYKERHELHVSKIVEQLKVLAFATEAKYDEAMEIFNEQQQNTLEELVHFHRERTEKLTIWFQEMLQEYGLNPGEPTFKLEIMEMFKEKQNELAGYIQPINVNVHSFPLEEEGNPSEFEESDRDSEILRDTERKFCKIL